MLVPAGLQLVVGPIGRLAHQPARTDRPDLAQAARGVRLIIEPGGAHSVGPLHHVALVGSFEHVDFVGSLLQHGLLAPAEADPAVGQRVLQLVPPGAHRLARGMHDDRIAGGQDALRFEVQRAVALAARFVLPGLGRRPQLLPGCEVDGQPFATEVVAGTVGVNPPNIDLVLEEGHVLFPAFSFLVLSLLPLLALFALADETERPTAGNLHRQLGRVLFLVGCAVK